MEDIWERALQALAASFRGRVGKLPMRCSIVGDRCRASQHWQPARTRRMQRQVKFSSIYWTSQSGRRLLAEELFLWDAHTTRVSVVRGGEKHADFPNHSSQIGPIRLYSGSK